MQVSWRVQHDMPIEAFSNVGDSLTWEVAAADPDVGPPLPGAPKTNSSVASGNAPQLFQAALGVEFCCAPDPQAISPADDCLVLGSMNQEPCMQERRAFKSAPAHQHARVVTGINSEAASILGMLPLPGFEPHNISKRTKRANKVIRHPISQPDGSNI